MQPVSGTLTSPSGSAGGRSMVVSTSRRRSVPRFRQPPTALSFLRVRRQASGCGFAYKMTMERPRCMATSTSSWSTSASRWRPVSRSQPSEIVVSRQGHTCTSRFIIPTGRRSTRPSGSRSVAFRRPGTATSLDLSQG
ncbi:putative peptidoglycan-binding LysM [Rhodococcus sp. MTM3W5.2]|nr:putative peptidoglycan-binding LysM [Rhodococcus sp. MTM3W5.2]